MCPVSAEATLALGILEVLARFEREPGWHDAR
jgi:hypothetical protein